MFQFFRPDRSATIEFGNGSKIHVKNVDDFDKAVEAYKLGQHAISPADSVAKTQELESRLLRQEHRLFAIISNFITRKRKYPDPDDPRRSAIAKAFWLNLITSPTVVAGAGGMLALLIASLSAYLLYQQNQLLQASLFPTPKYMAMIRPMVRAGTITDALPNSSSTNDANSQDLGIEERLIEGAFAANAGGALYIATVNLKLEYRDSSGVLVREEMFEAKQKTQLPVVAKASIVPVELEFTQFGSVTSTSAPPAAYSGPQQVKAIFSFTGVDANGEIWSAMIDTEVAIISDGESDIRDSAIYLSGSGDALRAEFRRGMSLQLPATESSEENELPR